MMVATGNKDKTIMKCECKNKNCNIHKTINIAILFFCFEINEKGHTQISIMKRMPCRPYDSFTLSDGLSVLRYHQICIRKGKSSLECWYSLLLHVRFIPSIHLRSNFSKFCFLFFVFLLVVRSRWWHCLHFLSNKMSPLDYFPCNWPLLWSVSILLFSISLFLSSSRSLPFIHFVLHLYWIECRHFIIIINTMELIELK